MKAWQLMAVNVWKKLRTIEIGDTKHIKLNVQLICSYYEYQFLFP